MAPPFRADHIGSFLRPPALLSARKNASKDEILRLQSAAIKDLVDTELRHNVRPITTGEFERVRFSRGFMEQIPGFSTIDVPFNQHRQGFPTVRRLQETKGMTMRPEVVATGKVKWEKAVFLDDWLYLRSLLPKEQWKECKITIPSPTNYHALLGNVGYNSDIYPNDDAFFGDVVDAYRKEIMALYEHGLRLIQIDDPNLSFFCDEQYVVFSKERNDDIGALYSYYITVHNAVLKDMPKDLRVGVHVCRGNMTGSMHLGSGSYELMAKKMFQDLDYDLYYLEFDSPRAGGFEPLRFLPSHKAVVLGVVTTKFPELEDPAKLKQRVFAAADIIAKAQGKTREEALKENLAISPQCGFSSMEEGGGIGVKEETQWEKLELVRNVAREIWSDAI